MKTPIAMLLLVASLVQAQTQQHKYRRFQVDASDCSEDYDTEDALPRLCRALAHAPLKDGRTLRFSLACREDFATCKKLGFGQIFEFEVVSGKYPECHPGKTAECIRVHARPYDLVYLMVFDHDPEPFRK
jgi:hypothetical protein